MHARLSDRRLAGAAATLLALAAAGCAGTRSFAIPPPSLPAIAEGHQLDAAVGVYFPPETAGRVASQDIAGPEGPTKYLLPVGDAVVDAYTSLLPRVFRRVERVGTPGPVPTGLDLDAVLEVALGPVDVSLPSAFETRPCRVTVHETFTLRDRSGEVVATFTAAGSGEQPRAAIVQCGGDAASEALGAAAEEFVRALSDEPALRAWLAGRGKSWVAVDQPSEVRRTLAHETSESLETEPELRVFGVYGGGGYFFPVQTATHFSSPQGGLALLLAWTWRPLPWVGLDLQAQNVGSSYGTDLAVPPAGFTSFGDRINLNQTLFAPTVRFAWPVWIAEPWVGGGPVLDFANLTWIASTTSGLGQTISHSQFAFGLLAGAGVDLVVSSNVEVGARWQWLWVQADFGSLSSGSASVGGQSVMVTGGYFWP